MALSQSALSELLDAFRAGDGVDLIRESVRTVLQELIEAEATEASGVAHTTRRLRCRGAFCAVRVPRVGWRRELRTDQW
jgi:transposase-like protein